jgi:hypothetical protein
VNPAQSSFPVIWQFPGFEQLTIDSFADKAGSAETGFVKFEGTSWITFREVSNQPGHWT